jgi:septal ring factor EnvC (AmiA/AmiB activator)
VPPQPDSPSFRPGWLKAVAAALTLGLISLSELPAQQPADREQAETRLNEILGEIDVLSKQLTASRTAQRGEQSRLRELDLAMQQANLEYRELQQQESRHQRELADLELQREEYLAGLDTRMAQLAEQLRSSYRSGRQSRMKLVLNQDDPAKLARMLAYYDYFNRAQVDRIAELRDALSTLDRMQETIDQELVRIGEVREQQLKVLEELESQRDDRASLLAQLTTQIDNEQARLEELQRDRKDLEALLERLSDVLADIPPDLGSHLSVPRQKGKLAMPVTGPVKQAFGQGRGGGLRWQGWLIGAPAGAEVKSIAYGRVAFADWLRGYGLLIIIDHGDGFMSLYGQNESLLHDAGDWVEPEEPISIVGSNPGEDQGLYFELRSKGKAQDPAVWLKR